MAAIQKIQASLYAIGKRVQGYHLLQNPKGTPQTEVNMVKEWHASSRHWDDMFETTRIKKTFSVSGNHEQVKKLFSTHYMDVDKLEITKPRKKDISLTVKNDGKYSVVSERSDIPPEVLDNRKEPKLSYERSFLMHDSEYDKMCISKANAQQNRGYYKKEYSLGQKIVALGMHKKMFYPMEKRPNFFKVLYKNLTNKGAEEQKYDLRVNYKHLV